MASSSNNKEKASTPDYYHYYLNQPLNGPSTQYKPAAYTRPRPNVAPPPPKKTFTEILASIDYKKIIGESSTHVKHIVKQSWFYKLIAWLIGFWIFIKLEFGAVYVVFSGFVYIFLNLGERKKGEQSAYSVFNRGHRELPGTLNARQFENELMMRGPSG